MIKVNIVKNKRSVANKQTNSDFSNREIALLNDTLGDIQLEFNKVLFLEDYAKHEDLINDLTEHVVICFGKKASTVVLGFEPADNMYYYQYNRFILPVKFAPNEVLHKPNRSFQFANDLLKVVKLNKLEKPEHYETNIKFIDTIKKFKKITSQLTGILAADIETAGLNYMLDDVIAFGFGTSDYQYIMTKELLQQEEIKPLLKQFLENSDITWLWQNGKFDTKFFMYQYKANARVDEDTMLLHYAIDERKGIHGLKELATNLLNAPDYESELKKYIPKGGSYDDVPKDILYQYLGYDVIYTALLYKVLLEKADDRALKLYKNILLPASDYLRDMEYNGMKLDIPYTRKLKEKYRKQLRIWEDELDVLIKNFGFTAEGYLATMKAKSFAGGKFNINSVPQVRYVIFHLLKLPCYGKGKEKYTANTDARKFWLQKLGMPTQKLDEPVEEYNKRLDEWLQDDVNRFVYIFDKYKILKKADSSYTTRFLEEVYPDGRIHPSFLLHGTETGRLSCTDPNIQNIPRNKELKNMLTVEDGCVLVEVDYSQAELRVLADLTKDPYLVETYRKGEDLHTAVARKIYGEPVTKAKRTRAKGVNFGLAYGRGAFSLATELGIDVKEAEQVIKDWFKNMPVAGKFINNTRLNPQRGIPTITPFGRLRHFPYITDGNVKHIQNEAINTPIQSIASDYTLLSGIELNKWLKETGYGRIVNTVHDAILIEIPYANVDKVANKAVNIMAEIPKKYNNASVPFVADIEVALHWGNKIEYNKDVNFKELK